MWKLRHTVTKSMWGPVSPHPHLLKLLCHGKYHIVTVFALLIVYTLFFLEVLPIYLECWSFLLIWSILLCKRNELFVYEWMIKNFLYLSFVFWLFYGNMIFKIKGFSLSFCGNLWFHFLTWLLWFIWKLFWCNMWSRDPIFFRWLLSCPSTIYWITLFFSTVLK